MKTRAFPEHNYKSIYFNGKTMRLTYDSSKPITELDYPEFMDIKVTNACLGQCPGCYMDSNPEDAHVFDAVEKIHALFGPMTQNQRPFQVACLADGTFVFGPSGAVDVQDLQIGDTVYDSNGRQSTVTQITTSNRECFKLLGSRGFSAICTPDHPFMVGGVATDAALTRTKELDLLASGILQNKEISAIDMASFVNKSSKRIGGGRGGSGGGKVTDTTIKITHNSQVMPRFVDLTEETMWLYGLSVAEGFGRGVALHCEEDDYANRAIAAYKSITGGLGATVRKNPNLHSQVVEFQHSQYYRRVFFEAMAIGYGARNKSIGFLFGLPKNLVHAALSGMFNGDGCLRTKPMAGNLYPVVSYKTSSKKLAYELVYLLRAYYGITASLNSGTNKVRYIDGRELLETDYYQVEISSVDKIVKLFPEFIESNEEFAKIGNRTYSYTTGTDAVVISSIAPAGVRTVYDITLDEGSSHVFSLSHGVLTHNCGGGEPTLAPYFIDVLKAFTELDITPNYTTNGMHLTQDVVDATQQYCGGVALSCHPHLEEYWSKGAHLLANKGMKLNFHNIISDVESVDTFFKIYDEYRHIVDYFVLLPYGAIGRATPKAVASDELFTLLKRYSDERSIDLSQIAFGANFFPMLKEHTSWLKVALYEPEIMSKYLDLTDMNLYPSSFNTKTVWKPAMELVQ